MAQRLKGRYGYPADDPFRPTFHPDRRYEPEEVKKPSRIFVCSQGELFAEGQDDWVKIVLNSLITYPQHTFLFLTKNYEQLPRWNPWPANAWVGASVTNMRQWVETCAYLPRVEAKVRFVSFEPLLAPISVERILPALSPHWIIIGAQSGQGANKHWPKREWIEWIIEAADKAHIPVFMKANLHQPFPDLVLRREFPDA